MKQGARITITAPAADAAGQRREGRWVYLGKNVKLRRQVEAARGTPRLPLGRGLQRTANELRQPFLDFLGEVGSTETDRIAWWSTTFSWRVWGASDLFLLVCYLRVAEELIDAAETAGDELTLVVEDDWLATQIAENRRHHVLSSRRPLWALKIASLALGLARRAAWLGQTLSAYVRQRRLVGRDAGAADQPTAAIYTYPMDRCLRAGGAYADALLPGMDQLLRDLGHRVIFFSPPERSGFENELAARRPYFRPLILYSTWSGLGRSLFARWRPKRRTWPLIAGLRIDHLARREFWRDASRAQWCRFRLFFECARGMMRDSSLEWIVFPFENQPWEKLLVMAARERGVRTAGVQHSTIGANYLSYFLGHGEDDAMPLPDAVLTAGTYAETAMIKGGHSPTRLMVSGSMRYPHLSGELSATQRLDPAPATSVLIGLPIDRPMAEHLLAAVAAAFPDSGAADGLTFVVKPHPMTPVDPAHFGLAATSHAGSVEDALSHCGTVIYVGSTIGPEGAAYGRRVLRYESELLLDVDVSEGLRASIPAAGDRDLRPTLLRVIAEPSGALSSMGPLFSPVNRTALNELFRRPAVYN